MLKDEEAFAREFDKKVRADEKVLEAEAWSRRMYDIKLLRQTLPPDDAYDFIYDAVMFYQIIFNIIDYFIHKCPDTDFNELVPEQMRPLFESFTYAFTGVGGVDHKNIRVYLVGHVRQREHHF